jgi:nitrate/TMAO reductase-like tetraheme cytochrome c subunit
MQNQRIFVVLAFAAVAAIVMPLSVAAQSADKYPNGCVSCHTGDRVIPNELAKVKGHPNVAKLVKSVPDGCLMCHKPSGKTPSLMVAVHTVHSVKVPSPVAFAGVCLNCHSVDAKGVATIKKGPSNW